LAEKAGRNGFRFPTDGRTILLRSSAFFLVGVILGLTLLNIVGIPVSFEGVLTKTELSQFSSYDDLKSFLNRSMSIAQYEAEIFGMASTRAPASLQDYSRTNIQVEGVDEADIVKTDGEFIYYVSDKGLIIARAYPPESAKVLAQLSFNGTIRGLLVNGDRLVVFEEDYGVWILRAEPGVGVPSPVGIVTRVMPIVAEPETRVWIYSLGDREKPTLARQISINGSYFTSRMIGDDAYVLVSQPARLMDGEVPLPVITYDEESETVKATEIYYSNATDYYYSFTTVLAFNIMSDEAPKYETVLVGGASAVYVSRENIYVAIPRFQPFYVRSPAPAAEEEPQERTEIHRIRITDGRIEFEASGVVPGRVLNQFSMDEYNGHFRIATTIGNVARSPEEATSVNNVYVLSLNLTVVGRLEGLAPGESIYSARFMGDRAYLVTFKKVDPLFVIDLKDPADPKVLGKLKITGYSDYLHPYDENHVIGIGKEAVAAEQGDFAWYQGVKISLFDVSDVTNPMEIAKYEIGDRGTDSPVLSDHKALLFDKKRALLVMPVLVAEIDPEKYAGEVPPYTYGDYVWQGVYVFKITAEELTLTGRVSHIGDLKQPAEEKYDLSYRYFVKRALYIGDVLYTVSDGKIKMNNLAELKEIGELALP